MVIDDPAPEPGVFGPLETLAAHAAGVLRRARLHDDLEGAYLATVTALANALEAKDADTHDHATETSHLAVAVGRRLGLRGDALRNLEFAAVLHDVGKIAIPDEILNRKGPLSDAEWEHVRDHTRIGERILRDIPFLAPAAVRRPLRARALGRRRATRTGSRARTSRWRRASSSPATRGA